MLLRFTGCQTEMLILVMTFCYSRSKCATRHDYGKKDELSRTGHHDKSDYHPISQLTLMNETHADKDAGHQI